ncbi:DUF7507 domain-containing protein [Winogradskyella bathintestinalis]|uniref:Gliding motility-associated C-terminal domain-containing protein n=1 Tax=Winogradskyella bathintestinalis TaxID=3035208 RepID=A0ABT7ZU65_9FLAO|nr:gliding motility-associated C-terminal domain-containing protein [Winogradskyella bathintestinalis]MDN3492543.1 gliding motility-associated C-terminal domain-containing protein [Winogradskyella bathintestinalis]
MKISTRFSKNNNLTRLFCITLTFVMLSMLESFGQNIPASNLNSNGNNPCYNCVPTNWADTGGTPDMSNAILAAAGTVGGGSDGWNFSPSNQLPLPPNNHALWISLRDIGGTEESVTTTMTNLTVGATYEIILYWFAPITRGVGQPGGNSFYAGTYIEDFEYQVEGSSRQFIFVNSPDRNQWNTTAVRFMATATDMDFTFYPGTDAAPRGTGVGSRFVYETVQLSITLDAINTAPVADDNSDVTPFNTSTTFNVTNTDTDIDGNIVDASVDLDVSTPGIQNTILTAQGTWSVDTNGDVTFTPVNGFTGTATLLYTVKDDYSVDSIPVPATSNQATLSVTVDVDPCLDGAIVGTVTANDPDADGINNICDVDDDNDGILDIDECGGGITILNSSTLSSGAGGDISSFSSTFTPVTGNNRALILVLGSEYSPADAGLTENATVSFGGIQMQQLGIKYGVKTAGDNNYIAVYALYESDIIAAANTNIIVNAVGINQSFAAYVMTAENTEITDTISPVFFDIGLIGSDDTNVNYSAPTVNYIASDNLFMFANSGSTGATYTFDQGTEITEIGVSGSSLGGMNYTSNITQSIALSGTISATRRSSGVVFKLRPSVGNSCSDSDNDGIVDRLDLDSDNDGIYDIVESGNGALDTNSNGFIDSGDTGDLNDADGNGANDTSELTSPIDTLSDGSFDFQNTDSDGDGCSDANEAYNDANADGGDGGQFGFGDPVTINITNGLVSDTEVDYTIGTNAAVTDATGVSVCDCGITDIAYSNETTCNNNGTPSDTTDDTFTADIAITFSNQPSTGTLNLTGDVIGTYTISVSSLTSPYTFSNVVLPANGNAISLTATFSDELTCTLENTNVLIAPFECSDDACDDVIPLGSPTAQIDAADITLDITGTGGASSAILNSISIAGEPNPFTELYIPSRMYYQFANPGASNQYIDDMSTTGANITNGATVFDAELLAAFTDRDLTHYLATDNQITNTDNVILRYDAPISAASNRYVAVTERNGNNRVRLQALDALGNLMGTAREINPSNYFDTTVSAVPSTGGASQNIYMAVYPLTSFVTSGSEIYGFILTQSGAAGNDGGDGKVFVMFDSAFLTPPPTINPLTNVVQPTCPSNEGSITVDATNNGGGTIEYSLTSLSGTNEVTWQTSNVFNNLPPDEYTVVVRYQAAPDCIAISANPVTLIEACCNITGISALNIDQCNDNGTPAILTDDTFTADITVTFISAPASGTLNLSGDGTTSVSVTGLTSPYTFVDVVLPANGNSINLIATFSGQAGCPFTNSNVFTAPSECSDDGCFDSIPEGSPTAQITSSDVTIDVTGAGGASSAILNSITIAGEPNSFTGFYIPSQVNYQFANPGASNQFVDDMSLVGTNITDGPIVFDPELLETFSDRDLTHYLAADNQITNTDYVQIRYDAPISAASNRYVAVTERDGNNRVRVQALDATGNVVGTAIEVNPGNYFNTTVPAIPSTGGAAQDIGMAVYPLTSFLNSGSEIYGFRVTQSGASGGDGADGKVFVMYDPAFLTPPPTIASTTSVVQPTCPSNEGSITIDAIDNGGGAIEYSINGAAGPWQTSNVFNSLLPDTYTPAVRYELTPECLAVSINPITLNTANCPSISLIKSITNNTALGASGILDDELTYTFTVTNTGNETLSNIIVNDPIVGTVLCVATTLLPGTSTTCEATYTVLQSDIDAGGIENTANVRAEAPGGNASDPNDDIVDVSDTGTTADGSIVADPETVETDDIDSVNGDNNDADPTNDVTPFSIVQNPSIEAEKTVAITNDIAPVGASLGDTMTYIITVTNTGDVTLDNVAIVDTLTDTDGNPLVLTTGPTFDAANSDNIEGILLVGESASYTATYVIAQEAVDAGGFENSVVASGDSPADTTVNDTSDDGDDTDGNTEDDPTETIIAENPSIEAEKTVAITNDIAPVGASLGDTMTYIITVTNTGDVTLDNVAIVDTLTDTDGNPLVLTTGPTFDAANSDNIEGILLVGESASYTATYVIAQEAVDAGGFENSVVASGDSPADTTVNDTSDDGDDTDGNTEDDPTETSLVPDPKISLIKTALPLEDTNGDGIVGGIDDIIMYAFTVENIGNLTLTNIVVEDDLLGVDLIGGSIAQLNPGESDSTTFTATYVITQADVDLGSVTNTASVSSELSDGDLNDPTDDITDISDDPNDTTNIDDNGDGDPDDPTVTPVTSVFDLAITKTVDETNPIVGNQVTFIIEVANIGNVTATNISIDEQIPSGYRFISALITEGIYSELNGEWIISQLNPDQVEILEITVEVLGFGEYLNTAYIQEFDGGDDIDSSNNEANATVEPVCLTIYNEFSPDGDGVNETFVIDCIEQYANNNLEVYNRWGNIVYSVKRYNNDWDGTSNGRAVINQSDELPVGTYYYVLDLGDGSEPRVGWLYINRNN